MKPPMLDLFDDEYAKLNVSGYTLIYKTPSSLDYDELDKGSLCRKAVHVYRNLEDAERAYKALSSRMQKYCFLAPIVMSPKLW